MQGIVSHMLQSQQFLPFPIELPPAAKAVHLSAHLTLGEVADKHTGSTPICGISRRTVECFEKIRSALGGKSLTITSGYRTPETNKAVGGAPESTHMLGRALDIIIPPGQMDAAVRAAERFFGDSGGIGIYPRHLHIDDRPEKARWKG